MSDERKAEAGFSEREKALAQEYERLDALIRARREIQKGGNIVEQTWRYFATFVHPLIFAAGIAVFVLFHAWEFYLDPQVTAAETRLQQAKASLDDAKSLAKATLINGEPIHVESVKAEVIKKQSEAARARIEANAMTAQVDGATAALEKAKAEVARQQAAANKAKLEADAATARFGLQTLTDRAAFVEYVKSEMGKISSRHDLAAQDANNQFSSLLPGYADQAYPPVIDAMCRETSLAKYIGCPARYYIRRAPSPAPSPPKSPDPDAQATNPSFDCAKARYPDEQAICGNAELARLDRLVAQAYAEARNRPDTRLAADSQAKAILPARRKCRYAATCIKSVQKQELDAFRRLGAIASN